MITGLCLGTFVIVAHHKIVESDVDSFLVMASFVFHVFVFFFIGIQGIPGWRASTSSLR
jgi:fucose 4-O-acetylase-like acetyltransferase